MKSDSIVTRAVLVQKFMAYNKDGMTRQVRRQLERIDSAAERERSTARIRSALQRDRLSRQADREKSGFYDGTMALANVIGERFGRMRRQKGEQGGLVRLG